MFGIGGGELIFIIFIALMLFGADKIPDIARTMGKAMAQFRNASNEIKSEIQKGVRENGLDKELNQLTTQFDTEVTHIKHTVEKPLLAESEEAKVPLEDLSGPIKRQ
ncbi:MAG: Sec-independent protein translocase TatA [Flavobacterium sp. BFFFF2]|nr:MAG: Sec-independent protein translocase TatA [Flavobacterium sp. BFFFF2]